MSAYVVTGGGGFIGSNIVHRLVADGHDVRVIDDFSTGRQSNLDAVRDRMTLCEGDLCDEDILDAALAGADFVLHEGARPSVQYSVEQPVAANRVNVEGTLRVLAAAKRHGVRRVVFATSSSIYGDQPDLPKHETMLPACKSPYAAAKLSGEAYCGVYNDTMGLETVCLRYFNVFGPRQNPKSQYAAVIPIFIRCALNNSEAVVYGDGEQTRDFTFVENVVNANLLAATTRGAAGLVANIGCGERYSLNQLLDVIGGILGRDVARRYEDDRSGDVKHSLADITRARERIGFEPSVGFEEGLRRTIEWMQENDV